MWEGLGMADSDQLERLLRSVKEWNRWREEKPKTIINLTNADLRNTNLKSVHLGNAKLIGAYLYKVELSHAYFYKADLSYAHLRNTNLSHTNLIKTQALNTNFEKTTLTGACITDWNINGDTNLDSVICEYIYLGWEFQNDKLTYTDRRPHDPNHIFAPGEFSRLFQIVQDSLSLYFKDGVDWQAAAYSFQSIATDGTPLNIKGIEQTGDGVIIKVDVPDRLDKGKVEGDFWKGYEEAQKAFEGERRNADRLITSQEKQIVRYEGEINRLLAIVENTRTINITGNTIQGTAYTEGDTRLNSPKLS